MLLVAVMGVVVLCYMVAKPSQDWAEIAYRMTWLVLVGVSLALIYYVNHDRRELTVRRTALAMLIIIGQVLIIAALSSGILPLELRHGQLLLLLPYGLAPSMVAVILGRKLGVYTAMCTTMFGMAMLPKISSDSSEIDYLVISMLAGFLSAILCSRVQKREQILYAGFATGAAVLVSAIALGCSKSNGLQSLESGFNLAWFAAEAAMALGVGFLSSVFVGGMMPLLEKLFNISTHITWLEWADMNHPVLKRLQMEAPSTFHHSLCVKSLAEAAAEAIGADATRAGVCGLYHDIGKLRNPGYFAENIPDQRYSPHRELTPEMSARILIQHVQDGVEMAREYKLNSRIISVIREHHGVSTPYVFYRAAMDKYDELKKKFDEGLIDTCPEPVDKAVFSYKGPIPQTRESGIVSMADAIESATRSLVNPTEQEIRDMIEGIVKGRILDGHLRDSQLTLGDIAKMKEAFFKTLRTTNHNRIAYPKPKEDEATELLMHERVAQENGGTNGASESTARASA